MKLFKTRKKVHGSPAAATPAHNAPTVQVSSLVEIAIETWRVEDRMKRLQVQLNKKEPAIRFAIEKIQSILIEMGIEIKDPTGEPYRDGLVLDVLAFDYGSEESPTNRVIQETVSPAIFYNGSLVEKAKVIIGRAGGQEGHGKDHD